MKQTLRSPVRAKKWAWVAGAAAVMVVLLQSRLTGLAGTLLTLGVLILFIDLLANAVLAEFEYSMIDDIFIYKRKFRNREKIIFYLPIQEMITILPENDPALKEYPIRGNNYLVPRFCEETKQVGIYQNDGKFFCFVFVPNQELLHDLKEKMHESYQSQDNAKDMGCGGASV